MVSRQDWAESKKLSEHDAGPCAVFSILHEVFGEIIISHSFSQYRECKYKKMTILEGKCLIEIVNHYCILYLLSVIRALTSLTADARSLDPLHSFSDIST